MARVKQQKMNQPRMLVALALVIVVLVIGGYIVFRSLAATPAASVEAGSSAIAPATTATDSTASGGNIVKFQASSGGSVSSAHPCVGNPPPAQWHHVIILMFENKSYTDVIGNSGAPYITGLVAKCGTAYSGSSGATPKNNWHDGDYKVDGSKDSGYNSKPSYAVLTNGLPGSVTGIKDDTYSTKTNVDNIYRHLLDSGKTVKDYFAWSGTGCSATGSGDYHDPIRYYSNITSAECNAHDVNISTFMNDLNSGNLPNYSFVLPTNNQNMHGSTTVQTGDNWAKGFLDPIFDSAQYKTGDTAVFFLWDEDTPIPNVLIAPSIRTGSKVPAPTGNPISHYSALRTVEEMLALPMIGNSAQAPSLKSFFEGH